MQIEYQSVEATQHRFISDMPERPGAVVESFIRCIESGEIQSAIGYLAERIISHVGFLKLESIFSTSSLEIGLLGGIESVEVQTLTFSRDRVEMRLTIWYGDHRVETEVVDLVREGARWRISMEEAGMVAMGECV